MKSFRFSPIQDKTQLIKAITYIHITCHRLCKQSMGTYLPVAGNVGVFCHFDDEYMYLKNLQKEITDVSQSVYGKYYLLYKPILIPTKQDIPETIYSYLYIRKPDSKKHHVGDIDFYIDPKKYSELKQSLYDGKQIPGARMLPNRPDLDLIELYDAAIDTCGYVGDKKWQ